MRAWTFLYYGVGYVRALYGLGECVGGGPYGPALALGLPLCFFNRVLPLLALNDNERAAS